MGRDERSNPFLKARAVAGLLKTRLYDRFQRPLQEGDVVHLIGRGDIMWRVQTCTPSFEPSVPPGTMQLQLISVLQLGLPGGVPVTDMIKVLDAPETVVTTLPPGEVLES